MLGSRKLLVVDDEAVICQACRRVFSRQGFHVDESQDARQGLARCMENDYDGILLDVKMPQMDGIQFLEALRKEKPDVPVLIMTGYPSVPNAAAALRLGASDYITKPFSPEEITQAVQRMLGRGEAEKEPAPESPEDESAFPDAEAFLFLGPSWLQAEPDGSARVGAVLTHRQVADARGVRLPGIGEVVYQGLPLAGLTTGDTLVRTVPSPVSGVVVAVNEGLAADPAALVNDPCGEGWIACVCTTRLDEELKSCEPRRVVLLNADEASAGSQREQLTSLGCRVHLARDWDQAEAVVRDPSCRVAFLDAASFGEGGPALAARLLAAAPSMKLIVIAPLECPTREAYAGQKGVQYAVDPFADNGVVGIVDSVFCAESQALPKPPGPKTVPQWLRSITTTNRNGHKVHLLAGPRLLQRADGLGWQISRRLIDRALPIVSTPGEAPITPTEILKTVDTCDRVMVLTAKDTGRLPGSLVRDIKAEFVSASGESTGRVTTLTVQPDSEEADFARFDDRTTEALADHIVQEMASY